MKLDKIFLKEIPADGLILNFNLSTKDLEIDLPNCSLVGEIGFKGILQRHSQRYLLSGQLTGNWQFQCDRCLKIFIQPVKTDLLLHYVETSHDSASTNPSFELDEAPEEIVTDFINLQDALIEQMILQIPMKALCSEDCKGLCSQCGQNLNIGKCECDSQNIDPRLLKLKKLLKK